MQELEENGIDVEEFIRIIRTYEQSVEKVWLTFKEGLNK